MHTCAKPKQTEKRKYKNVDEHHEGWMESNEKGKHMDEV